MPPGHIARGACIQHTQWRPRAVGSVQPRRMCAFDAPRRHVRIRAGPHLGPDRRKWYIRCTQTTSPAASPGVACIQCTPEYGIEHQIHTIDRSSGILAARDTTGLSGAQTEAAAGERFPTVQERGESLKGSKEVDETTGIVMISLGMLRIDAVRVVHAVVQWNPKRPGPGRRSRSYAYLVRPQRAPCRIQVSTKYR